MLSTRDLYRQIRSISETAQITKAMQMVATSKMRKAQQAAVAGRPFVRQLYRIQRHATEFCSDFTHPLQESREVRKRAVILISADKGLCGALNSNVIRLASEFDSSSTVFIVAGQKGAQFVTRSGRTLARKFNYSDTPHYSEAKEIAEFASELFLKGEVDEVKVVATRFVNTLTQQAICLEYLPVDEIKGLPADVWEPEQETENNGLQFLFEPGPESLLNYLLPHYLNIYIYQVLLNAKASEQSARMVSMKNATDNAERLIKELTLQLNKARQDSITQELLDIAGGKSESD